MSDDTIKVFGRATEIPKTDHFNWAMVDEPGEFMLIDKEELLVDHGYQRDVVSNTRILAIASAWSWKACGALIVVYRPDGTFWIIDGQHRWMASKRRKDITKLPCIVFETCDRAVEAKAFVAANTVRGPVHPYYKFRADLESRDPAAISIRDAVESTGYTISKNPGQKTVSCVTTLRNAWGRNESVARTIWHLVAGISRGEHVQREIFDGLFHLELYLLKIGKGSLRDDQYERKLARAGVAKINIAIAASVSYRRKESAKSWAQGILDLLNEGAKPKNRIPELYGAQECDE